jgi:MMPL family
MDYEVFVLSGLREEYDRTGNTDEAVVAALARKGRLVTSAALILAISFVSLSTSPNQLVQIIATALAFGILVDAVIIRTLLVPALVSLMGHWNWWIPPGFARLLRIPPGQPRRRGPHPLSVPSPWLYLAHRLKRLAAPALLAADVMEGSLRVDVAHSTRRLDGEARVEYCPVTHG